MRANEAMKYVVAITYSSNAGQSLQIKKRRLSAVQDKEYRSYKILTLTLPVKYILIYLFN